VLTELALRHIRQTRWGRFGFATLKSGFYRLDSRTSILYTKRPIIKERKGDDMDMIENTKLNLVEKIKKDISGFEFSDMAESEICGLFEDLNERGSHHRSCGTRIENIQPFSDEKEKKFFSLYATMRKDFVSESNAEAFDKLAQDIIRIQTILIYQHMPLVLSWMKTNMARDSKSRHLMSREDKLCEGHRVLIRCVDRFDCSRGIKFCTYVFSALNNMVLKDARDNKKRKGEVYYLGDIDFRTIPQLSSSESPALVEVKEIWDDCASGKGAASFLTSIERAIIQADFSSRNSELDQENKAKTLNMNIETFRKKKRNALQKIKDAIKSRLCRN